MPLNIARDKIQKTRVSKNTRVQKHTLGDSNTLSIFTNADKMQIHTSKKGRLYNK